MWSYQGKNDSVYLKKFLREYPGNPILCEENKVYLISYSWSSDPQMGSPLNSSQLSLVIHLFVQQTYIEHSFDPEVTFKAAWDTGNKQIKEVITF